MNKEEKNLIEFVADITEFMGINEAKCILPPYMRDVFPEVIRSKFKLIINEELNG